MHHPQVENLASRAEELMGFSVQAGLNEWNGIRYYRYRDLSASIYGRPGFWATVIMQQIASIGNNISEFQYQGGWTSLLKLAHTNSAIQEILCASQYYCL